MSSSALVCLLWLTSVTLTVGWPCDCKGGLIKCNVHGLGVNMFKSMERQQPFGNLLVSPVGLWWNLYTAYVGAKGATQTAIKNTLYPDIPSLCNPNAYIDTIKGKNTSFMVFKENTALYWLRRDLIYTGKLVKSFESEHNAWTWTWKNVKDLSNMDGVAFIRHHFISMNYNHIGNFLQPGDITKKAVFFLYTFLKFNDYWRIPNSGVDQLRYNGRKFSMIHFSGVFHHAYDSSNGATYIFLQLKYAKLQMVITVPDANRDQTDTSWEMFDPRNKQASYLNVSIPKFKFETEISLPEVMKDLGCGILFTKDCDLSGVNRKKAPTSQVIQKTIVSIDEYGVSFNAYTILVSDRAGTPREDDNPASEYNKPFLFHLFADDGVLVARGRIMDPTE